MRFKVEYTVEVDEQAWVRNYGCADDEVADQVTVDLEEWTADLFEAPKWYGMTTGPKTVTVTRL